MSGLDPRVARALGAALDVADLDADLFSELLAAGGDGARLPGRVQAEFVERARAGRVMARDVQAVLFAVDGAFSLAAREAALGWAAARPEQGMSATSAGLVAMGQPPVVYDEDRCGPAHQPHFTATASVLDGEDYITGHARRAGTRKRARHLAAVSLLAALAELDDPTRDELGESADTVAAAVVPAAVKTAIHPVSALHEYCIARGLPAPRFVLEAVKGGWRATLTDPVTGERYIAEATSKQHARLDVARQAVTAIAALEQSRARERTDAP